MCDVHDVTYFGVTCELDHPGLKCSCKMRSLKAIRAAMDNKKPISKTEARLFSTWLNAQVTLSKLVNLDLPGSMIKKIVSSLDPVGTEIGPDGWQQVETLDLGVAPGVAARSIATLSDGRIVCGALSSVKIFKERIDGAGGWDCVNLTEHLEKTGIVHCVAALPNTLITPLPFESEESAGASATKEDESADADKSGFASPPSELRFVAGGNDGTVTVWKERSVILETQERSSEWSVEATLEWPTGHGGPVMCVAVLGDGRFATGSDDNTVRVWKESSLQSIEGGSPTERSGAWSLEAILEGHSSEVSCVAVLPPLRCDVLSTKVPLRSFAMERSGAELYGVEDADGSTKVRLVTGSDDETVKVWSESSSGSGDWSVEATLTESMGGHGLGAMCVAVLGDGRFVTGGWGGEVKVWKESSLQSTGGGSPTERSREWSVEATLTEHSDAVYCVAVFPPLEDADGSTKVRFVTGSRDNTVKVWKENSPGSGDWSLEESSSESGDWSLEATLEGHSDYDDPLEGHSNSVYCVAVLTDGRLATGSSDKTIKVWG